MKKKEITLFDKDDCIIFHGRITSLPLEEEVIIQKSIEFFNDECPCFIHRSAVMKRLFVEIEEYLDKIVTEGRTHFLWADLPSSICDIIYQSKPVYKVHYSVG